MSFWNWSGGQVDKIVAVLVVNPDTKEKYFDLLTSHGKKSTLPLADLNSLNLFLLLCNFFQSFFELLLDHIKLPNWMIQMAQTRKAQNEVLGNLLAFCLKVEQYKLRCAAHGSHLPNLSPTNIPLLHAVNISAHFKQGFHWKKNFAAKKHSDPAHFTMTPALKWKDRWAVRTEKQHHGFASCNVGKICAHAEKLLGSPLILYRIILWHIENEWKGKNIRT